MRSIRDLERELDEARRQAALWGLSDRARRKREARVVDLERELEAAYAEAGALTGHGRRSRW